MTSDETPARPHKREQQRLETRQRVYEAALEVFRRDGVAAARIDEIVQLADVSRGSFYFHFPTKEDVLLERLRRSEEEIITTLAEHNASSLPELLLAVSQEMARGWETDPRIFPEVGMMVVRLTASGLSTQASEPVRAGLALLFRDAAARGELVSSPPPELLSDLFLVNLFGGALSWCGNPVMPLATMLRQVVEVFLNGVAARR